MTETKIEKRSISFAAAKSKFSNNELQVDSSSNESIDSIGKKFKYEVKLPGVIHTTTRKNGVGNELNVKKEANSVVSVAKKKKVTFADQEYHIIPNVGNHKESSSVQATVDDMLFGGIKDSTSCLRPQSASASNTKVVDDMLFEGIKDSTTCLKPQNSKTTLSDNGVVRTFSPTMRKIMEQHNIEPTNSLNASPTAVEKNVNLFNNINNKEQPTSHKQEPTSEMTKVNVKELVSKFRDLH